MLVVEIAVVAVHGKQFVVGAEFDNASAVQDGDAVGVADGGDAVRNENRRWSFVVRQNLCVAKVARRARSYADGEIA